jgi:hypothetical protein
MSGNLRYSNGAQLFHASHRDRIVRPRGNGVVCVPCEWGDRCTGCLFPWLFSWIVPGIECVTEVSELSETGVIVCMCVVLSGGYAGIRMSDCLGIYLCTHVFCVRGCMHRGLEVWGPSTRSAREHACTPVCMTKCRKLGGIPGYAVR